MKTDLVIYRDRLSDLSDCVLLHILSNLKSKEAVQTCILSTRWKNLWKSLTVFSLSSRHVKTFSCFTKFVTKYLALRDDKTALHALNLDRDGIMNHGLLKKIFKYAVSHNIQQLDISVTCRLIEQFPPCDVSCHSLTSLKLSVSSKLGLRIPVFPNSLKFPALTNLSLTLFYFRGTGDDECVEPFSEYKNLNSLVLDCCKVVEAETLSISSVTLVNLRVEHLGFNYKLELSTPNLCRFYFNGSPLQKLCKSNSDLSSIKHVYIDVRICSNVKNPLVLVNWLVELALMESLTVSKDTLTVLSLVPDLLKIDFPYLCNLKSLKVNAYRLSSEYDRIISFFRKNASSVEVYTKQTSTEAGKPVWTIRY